MNLFRNLILLILVAIIGALGWHLLAQDPGYVLVRYRGWDYTTNLLWVAIAVVAALFALWLLWMLVALPLRALRHRRERRSRERLGSGLEALHQGHYARAEKLLPQADDQSDAAVARLAAARAATARGDHAAARSHLDAIDGDHALTRAIGRAELALAEDRPTDALVALDDPGAQPLSPRGLALRAEALAASRQASEAYALLGALRQQQALPESALDDRERRWAAQALAEASDANALADRWETVPKPLRSEPGVVAAYSRRAAALGWDEAATSSIEHALDTRWDEGLAAHYGRLPIARLEHRETTARRWLDRNPGSPALLLTLARLARARGQWPEAEDHLHRAVAQGAGPDAWEELGDGYAATGDDLRARTAYSNALRMRRGDPITPLPPQAAAPLAGPGRLDDPGRPNGPGQLHDPRPPLPAGHSPRPRLPEAHDPATLPPRQDDPIVGDPTSLDPERGTLRLDPRRSQDDRDPSGRNPYDRDPSDASPYDRNASDRSPYDRDASDRDPGRRDPDR